MVSYLVTGGAGFIGSHIAGELVRRGARVTVIDDLSTGTLKNMEIFKGSVDFFEGDIRNADLVETSLEGIDAVVHHAALPSVTGSFENPSESLSVNITGLAVLLEACRKKKVNKIVFASSCAVYGDSPSLPKAELRGPSSDIQPGLRDGNDLSEIFQYLRSAPGS
jgi:nucleoside-diphosphate-sugar epimerase